MRVGLVRHQPDTVPAGAGGAEDGGVIHADVDLVVLGHVITRALRNALVNVGDEPVGRIRNLRDRQTSS